MHNVKTDYFLMIIILLFLTVQQINQGKNMTEKKGDVLAVILFNQYSNLYTLIILKKKCYNVSMMTISNIIQLVFLSILSKNPKEDVIKQNNDEYQNFYAHNKDIDFEKNPLFRPTATLIWYNFDNNELVAIGDSKARIDGVAYNDEE